MRPPPPLARIPQFPVITVVCAAAIFVTLAVKGGRTDEAPFVMNSLAFEGQPWRLASCALPHGDFFHIFFNIYWLWFLGTRLEEELGHVTTFVMFVVLAVGSAAAQYAFDAAGIGLSGVGYGIVGFLWVARRIDRRFYDAIDKRTLGLFGIWFVLCVVLTVTHVWSIGNFAHGAGFVIGAPLALAVCPGPVVRRLGGAVIALALVAGFVATAALWRDKVNLSKGAGVDDEKLAMHEIDVKDYESAARHFEHSLALSPKDSTNWYNYGVALQYTPGGLAMTPLDAFKRSLALDPKNDSAQGGVAHQLSRAAGDAQDKGDLATAEKLYRESLATKESATAAWNLSIILDEEDKHEESAKWFAKAHALDPKLGSESDSGSGSGSD
jgi:membrane associated rhomboid family serine protease